MDWYLHNMESIAVRVINDPISLMDLPPHTHDIFKSIPKKVGLLQHMCLLATYSTVFCTLLLPNNLVPRTYMHSILSQHRVS